MTGGIDSIRVITNYRILSTKLNLYIFACVTYAYAYIAYIHMYMYM